MARKAIIGLFKEDDMYEVIQLSMIDQYKRVGKKVVKYLDLGLLDFDDFYKMRRKTPSL